MAIHPKAIYRFNATPINMPTALFFSTEMENTILKFIWNCKELQIEKKILKNNNKVEELKLTNFKTYYSIVVIKTVWYFLKDKYLDQWNRIENPEITHTSVITRVKRPFSGERIVCSTNDASTTGANSKTFRRNYKGKP